ncbi:biotin--[acetyl-CoA-carboxylase] ligase [Phycisphaerales bacterium ac7]
MTQSKPNPLCHAGSPTTLRMGSGTVLVHRLDATRSTNDLARTWLTDHAAPVPAAWIAGIQTAGRGTRGRSWASPEGGLWMSLAMPVADPAAGVLPGLGLRVGVAAVRAVRESLPERAASEVVLRWPNDLVVARPGAGVRKIGGMLVECAPHGIVVGLGINVNNTPPATDDAGRPLRTPPVSVAELAGEDLVLDRLAECLLGHLTDLIPVPGLPNSLFREIEGLLHRPDSGVQVTGRDGRMYSGLIRGVSEHPDSLGALLLEQPNGDVMRVVSGDLS